MRGGHFAKDWKPTDFNPGMLYSGSNIDTAERARELASVRLPKGTKFAVCKHGDGSFCWVYSKSLDFLRPYADAAGVKLDVVGLYVVGVADGAVESRHTV